jgi:hypothetical protein
LDVLSTDFIVQDVRDVVTEDFLSPTTFVDTHHGHTDGPGGIANREPEIRIVCSNVFSRLHVMNYLCYGL